MGGQDEMGASLDKPGSGTYWAKPGTEEPRGKERALGVPWSWGVMEKVCRWQAPPLPTPALGTSGEQPYWEFHVVPGSA